MTRLQSEVVSLVMGMVIGSIILGAAYSLYRCGLNLKGIRFEVGDCIVLDGTERWDEEDFKRQIMEIGKHSYRTCHFDNNCRIGKSDKEDIQFDTEYMYRKVGCN